MKCNASPSVIAEIKLMNAIRDGVSRSDVVGAARLLKKNPHCPHCRRLAEYCHDRLAEQAWKKGNRRTAKYFLRVAHGLRSR